MLLRETSAGLFFFSESPSSHRSGSYSTRFVTLSLELGEVSSCHVHEFVSVAFAGCLRLRRARLR